MQHSHPHTSDESYWQSQPNAEQHVTTQPPMNDNLSENRFSKNSIKFHGTKAAFQIEPSVTRTGWHTVMVEAAKSLSGTKKFDWDNKIVLQITRDDLLPFISCVGLITSNIELKHYGQANNKQMKIEYRNDPRYGPQLFVLISQQGIKCAIPIALTSTAMIAHMALCQYIKNFEGLETSVVMQSLNRIAQLTKT